MILTEQQKADVKSQIDYAVYKYGGNMAPSVARAKAETIANKALLSYSSSKGSIKTYLSGHLQKLSRAAYKASSPVSIPESRLMSKGKVRDFREEYHDTYGKQPSVEEVSKGVGISLTDARLHQIEPSTFKTEASFENISGGTYRDPYAIVDSLPTALKGVGRDIYVNNQKDKQIMKTHGLGRTTYFKRKKEIDRFLKSNSENENISFR